MRRAVLGNGALGLGFDHDLRLRELFWPGVGLLNHVQGRRECRLLMWTPGRLLPLGGDGWDTGGSYGPGMSFTWRLVGRGTGVTASVTDVVDPYIPVWARCVEAACAEGEGPLGLYSLQAYALGENTIGESAAWDGKKGRLYHFKGKYWIAMGFAGESADGEAGVARAAVAKVRDGGVHLSRESGQVHGHAVDHGLIESATELRWHGAARVKAQWLLAFGSSREEADRNLEAAADASRVLSRSERFWGHVKDARESVLVIASHADAGGGIVAACDTGVQGDYGDSYRYVWPRDAAMCAGALLRAGMPEFAKRYISFCIASIDPRGFFWQRYRVDGTRGSGWHPWDLPGGDLPIQEDETALSLLLAGDYLESTGDLPCLHEAYGRFVRPAAGFICSYTSRDGELVRPSFDLWEERRGIFSFTQAACAGALAAAARIAAALGEDGDQEQFERGALLLLQGLVSTLSSPERGFCRGVSCSALPEDGSDWTCDASLFLVPLVLPDRDSLGPHGRDLLDEARRRSVTTWRRVRDALGVLLPGMRVPGYARYAGDWYCRPGDAGELPGNPWPVTTAWCAISGTAIGELAGDELLAYIDWFAKAAGETGLLPEQLDCVRAEARSVAPLAWSHAMHLELLSVSRRVHTALPGGEKYRRHCGGERRA